MANLIPNGSFTDGDIGRVPDGWDFERPNPMLAPVVRLAREDGAPALVIEGCGDADCIGWLATYFPIECGKTYRLSVRFRMSEEVDPNAHLLFAFIAPGFNNGVFRFTKVADGLVQGENRFFVPGSGAVDSRIRILFRHCAHGTVSIHEICMEECAPIPPRPVKVACTSGLTDRAGWEKVLDAAGAESVDLVLLPEAIAGPAETETLDGPSPTLMREKAAHYHMHVAGGFLLREGGRTYNVAALFGQGGELIGLYRKNHLYVTELFSGATPGREVPVFQTDFGRVGFAICYDSFFTDLFELQALKGAEVILLPGAGYYRSLLPARAADNGVRIVASSWVDGYGIWDTTGFDVTGQDVDSSRRCAGVEMVSGVEASTVPGTQLFHCDMSGRRETDGEVQVLIATLDLSVSAAPHGPCPMGSGPGGHRNRRGQQQLLLDEIKREYARWWEE
jgi:predicted amidohydrolase